MESKCNLTLAGLEKLNEEHKISDQVMDAIRDAVSDITDKDRDVEREH